MIGQKFNRLLIESEAKRSKWNDRRFNCICDCGNTTVVSYGHLKRGTTQSCGCLQKEKAKSINTKHGLAVRKQKHPLYSIWTAMRARCNNKNHKDYPQYGGRGITVCKEWDSFQQFIEDMGERPKNYSIDRINNEKGYSRDNCKWSSSKDQQNNKRSNIKIRYYNEIISETELAKRTGIARSTLQYWRKNGILQTRVQGVQI